MQSASLKQELPSVRREAPGLDPGEVHVEYADDEWKIHRKLEIESIVDDETVYVTKPDGFVVGATASEIPVEQRVFKNKRPDIDNGSEKKVVSGVLNRSKFS